MHPVILIGDHEDFEGHPFTLVVQCVAANEIEFELNYGDSGRRDEAISDACQVAPHILNLDSDLAEAYDDAFRTLPKKADQIAVAAFLRKWHGRIEPADLAETFFS